MLLRSLAPRYFTGQLRLNSRRRNVYQSTRGCKNKWAHFTLLSRRLWNVPKWSSCDGRIRSGRIPGSGVGLFSRRMGESLDMMVEADPLALRILSGNIAET